jgi:hypothetical protein
MALRSCLKNATKPSSSTTAKPRMAAAPKHGILHIEGNKIRETEVYFSSAPKEPA